MHAAAARSPVRGGGDSKKAAGSLTSRKSAGGAAPVPLAAAAASQAQAQAQAAAEDFGDPDPDHDDGSRGSAGPPPPPPPPRRRRRWRKKPKPLPPSRRDPDDHHQNHNHNPKNDETNPRPNPSTNANANPVVANKGRKGSGSGGGGVVSKKKKKKKGGAAAHAEDDDDETIIGGEAKKNDDDSPAVGSHCCVYLAPLSDFFRPRILADALGGWHPAMIVGVQRLPPTSSTTTGAVAAAGGAGSASSDAAASPAYEVTVASDFFEGRPRKFKFPSRQGLLELMERSDEDYSSLALRHGDVPNDRRRTLFQAQPEALAAGDLVFARYQAGDKWHRGRVVRVYPADEGDEIEIDGAASPRPSGPCSSSVADAHDEPTRMLCDIAYDGGGDNGRAAFETRVPFQEGSGDESSDDDDDDDESSSDDDDDDESSSDDDDDSDDDESSDDDDDDESSSDDESSQSNLSDVSDGDPMPIVPRDRPYVYLAARGDADLAWLNLELDRLFDGRELLPLRPDLQVEVGPEAPPDAAAAAAAVAAPASSSSSSSHHLIPLEADQLLHPNQGPDADADAAASDTSNGNEFRYFRYEDVVACVYEMAIRRHGSALLDAEWPTQPRIQRTGAARKRRNPSHKSNKTIPKTEHQ